MKKVFVASRFGEFKYIRKKLREELSTRGMEVIDLNDNIADSNSPIERSLENVRQSEIMLLLLGDTYGTVPFNKSKSFTHLEYEEALKTHKNIYVFCIGDSYIDTQINYSSSENMQEWQKQLENNHTLSFYDRTKSKDIIIDGIIKSVYRKPEPTVWIDEDTGLMWQVKVQNHDEHGRYPWDEIFNYATNLNINNYGGFNDWRVPTFEELSTLMIDKSYPNNDSSDGETFIKKPLLNSMTMKYGRFWSKTSNEKNSKLAYGVNFNRVRDNSLSKKGAKDKFQTRYIRCVRQFNYQDVDEEWKKVDFSEISSIELFLQKYPNTNSKYIDEAEEKLQELFNKEQEYYNSLSLFEKKLFNRSQSDKNIPESTFLFKCIEKGEFDSEKCEALLKLKELMQEENKWKESSTAKKPEKDKKYKQTLQVIELLKECT